MKRAFAIVGVCLLASIVIVSMAATKQGLTLRATPKPGSGTTVEFNLPKASEVNLSIYDITGKKVKDIVQDRHLEAGEHSYAWDGRNNQGEQVGSGIYFVRLQAGKEYRGCKLTYIAKSVVVSSEVPAPKSKITDEIREEHVTFLLKLAELNLDEQEILLGESCESFENVKQLARYIAKVFPQIEIALRNAIAHSTDDIDHKVNLPSFIFKATAGDGRPISTIVCEANNISKLELRSVVDLVDPTPYIWIPPECKEWTKDELPIIALSPASKNAKAVWACNIKGEEIILGLREPPSFPVVVITFEPPPALGTSQKTNLLRNATIRYLHVDTLRFWGGRWDAWPCSPRPEIYMECTVHDGQGNTYTHAKVWFMEDDRGYQVSIPCHNTNDGSHNCNCEDKPKTGDHGYVWYSPGEGVGHTLDLYPYFYNLKIYDDDYYPCGGEDDLMENVNLDDVPASDWYWGDHGECENVDVHLNLISEAR